MLGEFMRTLIFAAKNRKQIKKIAKETREIQESVKKAIRGKTKEEKKITKAEMRDILLEVNDVLDIFIEMTEEKKNGKVQSRR